MTEGFIFGAVLWGAFGIWSCAVALGRIEKLLGEYLHHHQSQGE